MGGVRTANRVKPVKAWEEAMTILTKVVITNPESEHPTANAHFPLIE